MLPHCMEHATPNGFRALAPLSENNKSLTPLVFDATMFSLKHAAQKDFARLQLSRLDRHIKYALLASCSRLMQ